jgi:hypothetical protein
MNSYMESHWTWIEGSLKMRQELLDSLSDADLAFNPGGLNMTLGALCREMGEVDHSYLQSLRTFKQDFAYRHADPRVETSVAALRAWYGVMETDMKATLSALPEADLKKMIDRGFPVPVDVQMDIYLQALLIFFGKVSIFLRAMNRPLSKAWIAWIA